jgi:hypothetical protein
MARTIRIAAIVAVALLLLSVVYVLSSGPAQLLVTRTLLSYESYVRVYGPAPPGMPASRASIHSDVGLLGLVGRLRRCFLGSERLTSMTSCRPTSRLAPALIVAGTLLLVGCNHGDSKVEQIKRGLEDVDHHAKEIQREAEKSSPTNPTRP